MLIGHIQLGIHGYHPVILSLRAVLFEVGGGVDVFIILGIQRTADITMPGTGKSQGKSLLTAHHQTRCRGFLLESSRFWNATIAIIFGHANSFTMGKIQPQRASANGGIDTADVLTIHGIFRKLGR